MNPEHLTPEEGGYSELESFQAARLAYDVTVRFCNRYIEKRNRSHEQIIQAARYGVQYIVKGWLASATSKTTELKLARIARASMEELRLEYENFLRQNNLAVWPSNDRRRKTLMGHRCTTVDEVALWVLQEHKRQSSGQNASTLSLPEITANAALTLIMVARGILDQQIETLMQDFQVEERFFARGYPVCTPTLEFI
ncbi:MAG: four helix bundle protein [Chlorobaculum sp.]|nr:four helix bundle protein [Chlorobaculum sp.]